MIEIIPKKTEHQEPLLRRVAAWSGIILLLLVVLLFAFFYVEKQKDAKILEGLKNELKSSKTAQNVQLENKLQLYESKIHDAYTLLNAHQRVATKIFNKLEQLVYPNVYFSSLDLQADTRQVRVSGYANSLQDLSQQLAIFENEPTIQEVILSDAKTSEQGSVNYRIDITFSPTVFK